MRRQSVVDAVLTGLAALLVWWGLTAPDQIDGITPSAFVRLPVEVLVLVALVLVLPWRAGRVVVVLAGVLLGLLTVFRVLDLGFFGALNRPFDPVIVWSYLDSAVGLVDDSLGRPAAVAALIGAALLLASILLAAGVGRRSYHAAFPLLLFAVILACASAFAFFTWIPLWFMIGYLTIRTNFKGEP